MFDISVTVFFTLVTDPNFIHLTTGLSVNETGLYVSGIWLVPNMSIVIVLNDKQTVREKLTIQLVTLASLSVTVPDRLVTFKASWEVFMSRPQSQGHLQPTGLEVKQISHKQ